MSSTVRRFPEQRQVEIKSSISDEREEDLIIGGGVVEGQPIRTFITPDSMLIIPTVSHERGQRAEVGQPTERGAYRGQRQAVSPSVVLRHF